MLGAAWFFWRRRRNSKREVAADYGRVQGVSAVEAEGKAISELHGQHRPLEADTRQVYEMPDTQQPGELFSDHTVH